MLPRIIYALLLIGSGVLVSNKGGSFSYVLFFSILLYLPIAAAYIGYTMWALHIYQDMEEKMKAILGTKVTVNHRSDNKGKIEIEYYSNDELERIYDMLQKINKNM